MPEVGTLSRSLRQSGIREIVHLAVKVPDAIRLEIGQPHFDTPPHIIEAAAQAARDGYTRYTVNAGIPSLREVVAETTNLRYGTDFTPDNVQVAVGAVGAISTAIRALVDPGDDVLLPDPGWPNYDMIVRCAAACPRTYTLDARTGFLPDPAAIARLIGPRTRVVIINAPSNPLGTVFPPELTERLVAMAHDHGVYLIADEVYERFVFDGRHVSAACFDTAGLVVAVSGVSKTYAMTGWRLGWALASQEVIQQMAKLQEAYVSCAPSVSQKAAEAALRGPQDCVAEMHRCYAENLRVACAALDRAGFDYVKPQGAFYVWVRVGAQDSYAYARRLLQERKVAVAPGRTFGAAGEGFVRLSLAAPAESIREGIERMAGFTG